VSIATSIQSIGFLTDIRESALVYPVIMTTHLACIAVFGGLIFVTDLRLLGALKNYSVTDVVRQLRPWKYLGFVIMVTMGILLGASEAEKYTPNPYFWTKLTLLCIGVPLHALIFKPLVYNRTEELDKSPVMPGKAKLAGALSLVLWISILTMGRLIGYYEPPQQSTETRSTQGVQQALAK
jgi:hypothetical protein